MTMIGKRETILKVRVADIAYSFVHQTTLQPDRPIVHNRFPEADKLHEQYSSKDGTRKPEDLDESLRYLSRFTGNILVVGRPDGLRVEAQDHIALVEFKTIWGTEPHIDTIRLGILQVQLYAWLIKPFIERLGLKLSDIHYVEIINRQDGDLIQRIKVPELPNPEELIWDVVYHLLDQEG